MNCEQDESLLKENEWREKLTSHEYQILRKAKTEAPFSGKYWDFTGFGTYSCRGCDQPLFSSQVKFDSGTGWPSFYEPLEKKTLTFHIDFHLSYPRKEVRCSCCQSHLGHIFDDGPAPSFKRYCINSAALTFSTHLPV